MEIQEMEVHQTVKKYILTEDEYHSLINQNRKYGSRKIKEYIIFCIQFYLLKCYVTFILISFFAFLSSNILKIKCSTNWANGTKLGWWDLNPRMTESKSVVLTTSPQLSVGCEIYHTLIFFNYLTTVLTPWISTQPCSSLASASFILISSSVIEELNLLLASACAWASMSCASALAFASALVTSASAFALLMQRLQHSRQPKLRKC